MQFYDEDRINKTRDMISQDDDYQNKTGNKESTSLLYDEQKSPNSRPAAKMLPMSPLAASATVINLILATGPFRYLL